MKTIATVALGALLLVGMNAGAHSQTYVNVTGDLVLFCDLEGTGVNQGGVCIPAGDIVPDDNGEGSVSIAGELNPSSGYYCQDLDGSGACDGGSASIFCASHPLTDGVNWDSSGEVLVFADGPIFGNPALSACGLTYSGSVQGTVSHS